MSISVSLYRKMEGLEPSLRDVLLSMAEEVSNTPTKEDFSELKTALQELAKAQKESQKEIGRLDKTMQELAEAQKRTEIKVEELAEAQKNTEIELRSLTKTVKRVQVELGGLSNSFGYQLEDSVYPILPDIIKDDFGIELKGDLERRFIVYPDGRDDEVNIYGEGKSNGKDIYVIGESKAQIGKGDVKDFAAMVKRLESHFNAAVMPLMVCYSIHPRVEQYIKTDHPGIKVYQSFHIKRRK